MNHARFLRTRLAALLLPALLLPAAGPASARDHVLLLTVSEYRHVTPLPGAKLDRRNALELAERLGYDTRQARVLADAELAGDGIRRAVLSLAAEVQPGDRLFLYYSGHGTSFPADGGCAEALVPQDATGDPAGLVRTSELIAALDGVRDKLADAFVFFDACHAGGLRDLVAGSAGSAGSGRAAQAAPALVGRSIPVRSGAQCLKVANRSAFKAYAPPADAPARGLNLSAKRNFTFVAAAREDEEALDLQNEGGLATTALLHCARQGVANPSGTGVVSVEELRACAQARIDAVVPTISRQVRPHHLEVFSNLHKALANVRVSDPPAARPPTEAERVLNVFEQVAANSNPNLGARAWFAQEQVALGRPVDLHYSVTRPGFLSVLYVGSDRRDLQALLTNHPVGPSASTLLGPTTITEPAGDNRFLVLYTREPVDLAGVLQQARNGQKVSLSAAVSQGLACAAERQRSQAGCGPNRNATAFAPAAAAAADPAFAGYGAWLLTVRGQ